MSWQNESVKWRGGRIPEKVDKDDVLLWLKNDDTWNKADKLSFIATGSHIATIYVKGIGAYVARCDQDIFQVSCTGGRWIKKWIVEVLVKIYAELEAL